MSGPNPKDLKRIAAACRAAGIKSYKCADFEFVLTDEAPISNYKKRTSAKGKVKATTSSIQDDFETDALTQDQLLMWSAGSLPTENTEETQEVS